MTYQGLVSRYLLVSAAGYFAGDYAARGPKSWVPFVFFAVVLCVANVDWSRLPRGKP